VVRMLQRSFQRLVYMIKSFADDSIIDITKKMDNGEFPFMYLMLFKWKLFN